MKFFTFNEHLLQTANVLPDVDFAESQSIPEAECTHTLVAEDSLE